MATYYLINVIYVGTQKHFPGELIDTNQVDATAIANAGGLLWPSSDAVVASAAAKAQIARTAGRNEEEMHAIMQSAVDQVQRDTDARMADVANLAALALADDSVDETEHKVLTFKQKFVLDRGDSVTTVNDHSIIASLNGFRWKRVLEYVPEWSSQLTWYHDPVAGSDENSGATSLLPVKTCQEINRRVRLWDLTTYTINGVHATLGYQTPDSMRMTGGVSDKGTGAGAPTGVATAVIYKGPSPPQAGVTDALLAATATTGNVQASIQHGGLNALGTTYLGHAIEFSTGAAAGARCMIGADLTGDVVEISEPAFPATGVRSTFPGIGDTFKIINPVLVNGPIAFQGLSKNIDITHQDVTISSTLFHPNGCTATFQGCVTTVVTNPPPVEFNPSVTFFRVCAIRLAAVGNFCNTYLSRFQFVGCGQRLARNQCSRAGIVVMTDSYMTGGGCRNVDNAPGRHGGGTFSFAGRTSINRTPAGEPGISTFGGGAIVNVLASATLLGKGNAVAGVSIDLGSKMFIQDSVTPTIAGGAADAIEVRLDGMATAMPPLEADTQYGTGTLVAGVSANIVANVTATSRIYVSAKDHLASTAIGRLSAPSADRVNGAAGTFKVRAFKSDTTAETGDESTFEWRVVPSLYALTLWSQWAAAPFSRHVMSYKSGASINSRP